MSPKRRGPGDGGAPKKEKGGRRRGRGDGGLRQRPDGRWEGRLSYIDASGKRQRPVVFGATRGEARDKLDDLRRKVVGVASADASSMTVAAFLQDWLDTTAKGSVAPTTWQRYEELVRLYGVPYTAHVRLDKLNPFGVKQVFAKMDEDGVTAWNRKMTAMVLSYALDHAVSLQLIAANPCAGMKKAKPDEKPIRPLAPPEVKTFLAAARGVRLEALFVLAVATGMRQGELLGLWWEDIDFDKGIVSVRRSLAWLKKGGFTLKEPKTKRSRRTIDLPAFAVEALSRHRQAMLKEGHAVQGPEKVFCTKTGNWVAKGNMLKQTFRPLLRRADRLAEKQAKEAGVAHVPFPDIRFHDLRHTHASNLLQKRMPVEDVSARLGHANVATTYRVYSHLIPKSGNDAAQMTQQLFG